MFTQRGPMPSREQRVRERSKRMASMVASIVARPAVMEGSCSGVPIEKECASQHRGYMAAVRALGYCMRCACRLAKGKVQFCHADQGKGTGIKTDVRRGWPGCAYCHWLVGTSGVFPKEDRRSLEDRLGRQTRAAVRAARTWPPRLPEWEEAT